MNRVMPPLNLKKWIDDHRELLKPPVGNKMIWENQDFIAMIVGGPNSRTDFHIDESEEFFHQLEGDMILKVRESGKTVDIPIREGEVFLLPPRVPHSPRRPAGTVGLVIERKRQADEKDGFAWFCEECGEKLYEDRLHVSNIVTQLPPVFDKFFNDPALCTCKKCGTKATRK